MSHESEFRRWLLLIYRVPQDPPGRRTYVWRQLKQLGAHYLQQAAVILPDKEEIQASLEVLSNKIRDFGGEASLLATTSPDLMWQQETIERFNQARDAEYIEIMENIERFGDEIERERRKERFTFAQLEDIEADCDKLQRWYTRVTARDFFGTSRRSEAEESLKTAQAALETFTAEVYAREGIDTEADRAPGC